MAELENQLKKINGLRDEVKELQSEKARLTGKIETQEKTLAELEKECQEKFGCKVEELDDLWKKLGQEADKLIEEAELILKGSDNE